MAGRWERRVTYEPGHVPWDYGMPHRSARSMVQEVWVEDPPIGGRREFQSPYEADQARVALEQMRHQHRGVLRDPWARREEERRRELLRPRYEPDLRSTAQTATQMIWDEISTTTTATTFDMASLEQLRRQMTEHRFRPEDYLGNFNDHIDSSRLTINRPNMARRSEERSFTMDEDPYSELSGAYTESYVGITMDKAALNSSLSMAYWTTNGAIHPDRVARVLKRYYSTQERVNALLRREDGVWKGPKLLHPNPRQLGQWTHASSILWTDYRNGTGGMVNFAFMWLDGQWMRRGAGDSQVAWKPIGDEE